MNRRGFLQAIGISPVAAIATPKQELPKQFNPLHKSLQPGRLCRMPERIYADEWAKRNKRHPGLNSGFTFLEWILCPSGEQYPPPASERDAQVAASFAQWLGTNCGLAFIQTCEQKIKQSDHRFTERQIF